MDSAAYPYRRHGFRWWRRQAWWWLHCKLRHYPIEVYRTISPHPPPPATAERLRRRVLSGDWMSPDV